MIIKEVDEIETSDKFLKAGLSAEKQLAFYLQRAFRDDENVLVLTVFAWNPMAISLK
jgi:hypothetical protein